MEQIIHTLTHNWILGGIALLIIFFIIGSLIRTAIKMALVALVVGVIMVVFIGLTPEDVINKGKSALDITSDLYANTIHPLIEKEIDKADYSEDDDGDYTIKTDDLKIKGNQDANQVTIDYKGKTYTLNTDDLGKEITEKIRNMNQ